MGDYIDKHKAENVGRSIAPILKILKARTAAAAYHQCFWYLAFDAQRRTDLIEIVEDRNGKSSMIVTSKLPVSKWHEVNREKTIADAILNRIVHHQ